MGLFTVLQQRPIVARQVRRYTSHNVGGCCSRRDFREDETGDRDLRSERGERRTFAGESGTTSAHSRCPC